MSLHTTGIGLSPTQSHGIWRGFVHGILHPWELSWNLYALVKKFQVQNMHCPGRSIVYFIVYRLPSLWMFPDIYYAQAQRVLYTPLQDLMCRRPCNYKDEQGEERKLEPTGHGQEKLSCLKGVSP
jgi:hypothetical protein